MFGSVGTLTETLIDKVEDLPVILWYYVTSIVYVRFLFAMAEPDVVILKIC